MDRIKVKALTNNLPEVMSFIETNLKNTKSESKDIARTLLISEECYVSLCGAAKEDYNVSVSIKGGKIRMQASGEKIELKTLGNITVDFDENDMDELAEARIRSMILKANEDILSASYRNGINSIRINARPASQSNVKMVLGAFFLAILVGLLLRFMPANVSSAINTYFFSPVKSIFINALKMLIAPLVFFSIAASVGSFTDLKQLGKISSKIVLFYTFTTVLAIILGLASFYIFNPGTVGMFTAESTVAAEEVSRVSFLTVLVGIVPNNFFGAFVSSDMLQLIFLAILFGLATATLGSSSSRVADFFNGGNDLFMKVAEYVTKFMPLIVFVSIASLIVTSEPETIFKVITITVQVMLTQLTMVIVYGLLVFIFTGKNPFVFLRKIFPAWLNAFALSSSNAAMSYTMETCDKKLGISPKIYSFSIPLGATINMDGLSILLTLTTLFFAKAYGAPLTAADIPSLIFTVIVLSCGTPGMPGASVLCCSVLFQQFGIPMEAVAIFIAMDSILDPFSTADNVAGDMVGTYIIASREGMTTEK